MHRIQATQSSPVVKTMFPDDVKEFTGTNKEGTYTLLDVRQPFEYEEQHLPGAVLVPLPQLVDSLGELDSGKPTIVYCAMGGRSRMAAQLLANRGFKDIYQLEGGIEAWEDRTATGPREFHLKFIMGDEAPIEVIRIAYQMEEGMKQFHALARAEVEDPGLKDLLGRLIEAEESHERSLLQLLPEHDRQAVFTPAASGGGGEGVEGGGGGEGAGNAAGAAGAGGRGRRAGAGGGAQGVEGGAVDAGMMEGGVDVNGFLSRNARFLGSVAGYLELAMMIETQALDLYLRMASASRIDATKSALLHIADEEKLHLAMLARFLEQNRQ